ncbi:MAG TPA: DUF3783 domain-containing protein [Smithellaceae bacterium]|jgi:hypothetical protein|nr:DUF3783 domain-containing protein [Syntrophaceae bacterium]HNV57646.1 DUF3783 domain-containing protein [Smithellaceae bacterium]HNY97463.1 DUF3783 domain-containing protein [Smithellaceae bacterium]HOD64931.1 DUF3783 domain-containing protein [Smithellaceae bacterium]HOE23219.1 DUF3783 domain-containing protein [Smithellaceae bacterium]
MQEKIICFSLGLSSGDVERGRVSFNESCAAEGELVVVPVTGAMLERSVGDALERVISGSAPDGSNPVLPDLPYRVVVVAALEREQVFSVMRSFKAVLPDPQSLIFAVITETALGWTFRDYAIHLAQEHEEMKARSR